MTRVTEWIVYILVGCVVITTSLGYTSERSPVLIWTDIRQPQFPVVLAGHTVNENDFKQTYVQPIIDGNSGHILVFVQDKLSVADISHYASVYGYGDSDTLANVKELMSTHTSTHIPNVVQPLKAFKSFTPDKFCDLAHPYNVNQLKSSCNLETGFKVIVVKLPDISSADRKESFRKNDELIGSIYKDIKALVNQPITAFFTSFSSSIVQSTHDSYSVDSAPKRSLLATTSNASVLFLNSADQIFLYTTEILVHTPANSNGTQLDLDKVVLVNNESPCTNDSASQLSDGTYNNCTMKLNYTDETIIKGLSIQFTFTANKYNYWIISAIAMTYVNESVSSEPLTVEMNPAFMVSRTPLKFSYSCTAPPALKAMNLTDGGTGPTLTFKNFQVQAFGVVNGQFGMYNDCEGFFTLGIWMAIISAAVLISILIFGFCMIGDITTMDRFDDPKGKSIIVASTD